MKNQQLEKTKEKNNEERFNSLIKLVKSKESLKQKNSLKAEQTREKLGMLNSRKKIEESRIWESNHVRDLYT